MDCEQAQLLITLAVYGELPDDKRPALELHLSACSRCRSEFEEVTALREAMSSMPGEEPSANLLAKSRIALDDALDIIPASSWFNRTWRAVRVGGSTLSRAPVAASALLVFGLCLGGFSGYRAARQADSAETASARNARVSAASANQPNQPIQVADVSSIAQDPDSQNVEVRFNRVVPDTLSGPLGDPEIRQLLLMGAQSPFNVNVQQASVSLLAQQCKHRIRCAEGPVRHSLLVALLYAKNADVRLKALSGLEPYIGEDVRVRDAVLESLMKDPDPTLRSRALAMLEPVQVDTSVREVIQTVAAQDNDPQIRTVSREVLEQMPPLQ